MSSVTTNLELHEAQKAAEEEAVAAERRRTKALEAQERNVVDADQLRRILKQERQRMAQLARQLARLKCTALQRESTNECHEEEEFNAFLKKKKQQKQEQQQQQQHSDEKEEYKAFLDARSTMTDQELQILADTIKDTSRDHAAAMNKRADLMKGLIDEHAALIETHGAHLKDFDGKERFTLDKTVEVALEDKRFKRAETATRKAQVEAESRTAEADSRPSMTYVQEMVGLANLNLDKSLAEISMVKDVAMAEIKAGAGAQKAEVEALKAEVEAREAEAKHQLALMTLQHQWQQHLLQMYPQPQDQLTVPTATPRRCLQEVEALLREEQMLNSTLQKQLKKAQQEKLELQQLLESSNPIGENSSSGGRHAMFSVGSTLPPIVDFGNEEEEEEEHNDDDSEGIIGDD